MNLGAQALVAGALLSAIAAAGHLTCIIVGAPAYRFMGASERTALAVEAGKRNPALVTLALTGLLLVWAAYALSGAGVIDHLPLTKLALPLICCIYLARAVCFPLLKSTFPENSNTFWLVSSGICLIIGLVHLYGVVSRWSVL